MKHPLLPDMNDAGYRILDTTNTAENTKIKSIDFAAAQFMLFGYEICIANDSRFSTVLVGILKDNETIGHTRTVEEAIMHVISMKLKG